MMARRSLVSFSAVSRLGLALALCSLVLAGSTPEPLAAAVDMTRYVSLGDSLTMGVISASIGEKGQLASYPRQLHFAASSGPFEQPLVSDPGLPARMTLKSLSPLVISPEAGIGSPINLTAPAYQNLGISGANVSDTLNNPGIGTAHALVLRGLGTAVQQAVAQSPTFITLWIGNNDVLGAAVSGIVIDGITLTPADAFEADFRAVVEALAATGADIAFANIGSVTSIPFVNTIAPVLIDPTTQRPVLIGGQPVPLIGPDGLLAPNDKVLLTAGALLARGDGIPVELGGNGNPLPDTVVLNAAEVAAIGVRIAEINAIIATVAAENGAALVDVADTFGRLATRGLSVGGIDYTTELFGGIFSFDGVHPSPFGYAVVTNEFIREINRHFGGGIPLVSFAPFINGGGGDIGTIDGIDTSMPFFSSRALRNLRKVLDQKHPRTLTRLKKRWLAEQEAAAAEAEEAEAED